MHATNEFAVPPPSGSSRRLGSRRGRVAVLGLALSVLGIAALVVVFARPEPASAQPPQLATLSAECADGMLRFHMEMPNPRSGTFNFAYLLTPSGETGPSAEQGETSITAGQTFEHDFDPIDRGAPHGGRGSYWVLILDADANYSYLGVSNTVENPCEEPTTTTTTTTTSGEPTTTTTTTSSETTTSEESTDTSTPSDTTDPSITGTTTDGSSGPPSDSFANPSDTDSPGAVDPASSSGSSGGALASTGIPLLVLLAIAGVLLANGLGLIRLTRGRTGEEDLDD